MTGSSRATGEDAGSGEILEYCNVAGPADGDSPLCLRPGPGRVVGVGEGLIRLTAPGNERLEQAGEFVVSFGGSELNVLVALSRLGRSTRWVTRVPDNVLGRRLVHNAIRFGIEVCADQVPGSRLGLFFVELGTPPRAAEVLYDRAHSAGSELAPEHFDWDALVADAAVVHTTGITLALGSRGRVAVARAYDAAHRVDAISSFEVNFRSRMWGREEASRSVRNVLPEVDLLFASPEDVEMIVDAPVTTERAIDLLLDDYGVKQLVLRRTEESDHGGVRAQIDLIGTIEASGPWVETTPVDPFGAGDVASAICIDSILSGIAPNEIVTRAARGWAHMYTIPGDTWLGAEDDLCEHGSVRRVLR